MINFSLLVLILSLIAFCVKCNEFKKIENAHNLIENEFTDLHSKHSVYKRAILRNLQKNWTSPILFYVQPGLSKYRHIISATVRSLSELTCLQFNESSTSIENNIGIVFAYNIQHCQSNLGRFSNVKNSHIFLSHACAKRSGIIMHELLHALGMKHEHTRYDRDHYVAIFDKYLINNPSVVSGIHTKDDTNIVATFNDIPYDYGSIMHYPRVAFVKFLGYEFHGKFNSIEAKNIYLYTLMLGQRERLSFSDVKTLNYYYCSDKCKDSMIQCKNGGYKNYDERLCGRCVCPKGYYGNDCSKVKPLSEKCSEVDLTAGYSYKVIGEEGNKNCNYRIKAEQNKTIHLVLFANTKQKRICASGIGLEVKYLKNKGVTGLCICGNYDDIHIVSESDEVYIEYNGLRRSDRFHAFYALAPSDQENSIICDKDSCYEKKGNYYEKVNKSYKMFEYGLVPDDYPIIGKPEYSSEEHLGSSEEDYSTNNTITPEESIEIEEENDIKE
uniref:Metalloendopeptidase n=1 Tax=Parastrongyloides trichosuri TaxID=131310 RepID=A0A0N4ZZS9_PARTI